MRYFLLLTILICFSVVSPIYAQKSDSPECDVKAAQEFYDQVDPDQIASIKMLIAISSTSKASAKFAAIDDIRDLATTVEDLDYPDCVKQARDQYLAGIVKVADALEAIADGNIGTFTSLYAEAVQRIGEFRGYLMALGVEVQTSETQTIFMR